MCIKKIIAYGFAPFALTLAGISNAKAQNVGHGIHDTIRVYAELLPNGDTIPVSWLPDFYAYSQLKGYWKEYYSEWKRLKNAVYVTYPYAIKAASVINDINRELAVTNGRRDRRKIIKSKEKELKNDFSDKLKNLSVYQGRVLMKLINRQTGNNCYEIIQEYKGGLPASVYQGVASLFGSSLKQPYSPAVTKTDKFIEIITRDLEMRYGYYTSAAPR